MNKKKAQLDMHPVALIMGVFGLGLGWVIAGRMDSGIVLQIMSAVLAGAAGFFIANTVANN